MMMFGSSGRLGEEVECKQWEDRKARPELAAGSQPSNRLDRLGAPDNNAPARALATRLGGRLQGISSCGRMPEAS